MARPRPKDHKLSAIPADGQPKRRGHAPAGGYIVSCSCGWDGGTCRVFKDVEKVFARHVETVSRYSCKTCNADISTDVPKSRRLRQCTPCRNARKAVDRDKALSADAAAHRHRMRSVNVKSKYGLAEGDVRLIFLSQYGLCKICNNEISMSTKQGLHIDHCHTTGRIRGLLCSTCNTGLGCFRDNPISLAHAIAYLASAPMLGNDRPIPAFGRLNDGAKKYVQYEKAVAVEAIKNALHAIAGDDLLEIEFQRLRKFREHAYDPDLVPLPTVTWTVRPDRKRVEQALRGNSALELLAQWDGELNSEHVKDILTGRTSIPSSIPQEILAIGYSKAAAWHGLELVTTAAALTTRLLLESAAKTTGEKVPYAIAS